VVRFNAEAAAAGLEKLAAALGHPVAGAGTAAAIAEVVIEALEAIFDALQTPKRLRDVGVARESLPHLAAISMEDWFVHDNPRRVNGADDLQQVLEAAW